MLSELQVNHPEVGSILDACSFRHLHNLSQRGKNNSCLTTKFRNSQNSNFPVNKMTGENYLLKF